jgi:hypothetical protein
LTSCSRGLFLLQSRFAGLEAEELSAKRYRPRRNNHHRLAFKPLPGSVAGESREASPMGASGRRIYEQ